MSTTKKILVIGGKASGKLTFVKSLTGSLPSTIPPDSHGGLTHELAIKNQYYEALAGVWIDEFEESGFSEFIHSYASSEAEAVRQTLNVIIVTFCKNETEESVTLLLQGVKTIAEKCSPEILLLAIGTKEEAEEASYWDDLCLDEGYEYVDLAATGKNTFGEECGLVRAMEAIAACDWSQKDADPTEEELLAELMAEDTALNEQLLKADLTSNSIDVEEANVEDLERMMARVLAARDHLQDLSPEEKKRQAARLVAEIMR